MSERTSKRGREADATRPVRTVFLERGAATDLHHHSEPTAWLHVVSGAMVDERWSRDADGRLVHERRVLRRDQALAARADSLHRVRALEDTAFVTTCADGCGCARIADDLEAREALFAESRGDETARVTSVGGPSVS